MTRINIKENVKRIKKSYLIFLLFILPTFVRAETIAEYVIKAQNNPLWENGTCGIVEPVPNFDPNKMLENAFKSVSLAEGKPEEWKILENKKAIIHGVCFYLIRFVAFDKERIFVFDLNAGNGKWCVR